MIKITSLTPTNQYTTIIQIGVEYNGFPYSLLVNIKMKEVHMVCKLDGEHITIIRSELRSITHDVWRFNLDITSPDGRVRVQQEYDLFMLYKRPEKLNVCTLTTTTECNGKRIHGRSADTALLGDVGRPISKREKTQCK